MDITDTMNAVSRIIIESDASFFIKQKKNQRIDVGGNGHIYALSKGTVSFYRVDDNVLSHSISAPAIIGLSQFGIAQLREPEKHHYYIRCNESCEMWVTRQTDIIDLFDTQDFWKYAFYIQSFYLALYLERDSMVSKKTVRDIVIEHIKFICNMETELRNKTSIYTFILTRNHISRSSVHKIVAELVSSGKITIKRGKLINFCTGTDDY